jgi:hypothetical protein
MTQPAPADDAVTPRRAEFTAGFEITGWNENAYDEPAEGPKLTRATVHKTFHDDLEGTSVTEMLTAQGDGGRGYLASERFDGTIGGRQGTVVFQHGGLDDGHALSSFGHVVPGSGTGALAGTAGEIVYDHDETGITVKLVLTFPE